MYPAAATAALMRINWMNRYIDRLKSAAYITQYTE